MAITTSNMGLVKWTELMDPYDHTQLAGNFQRIDEHDHTTGKGKRLSGAALENEAIDTAQLKDKSVTNAKLAGGISGDKLAGGVVATIGDTKLWWRPNSLTPLPGSGWVIMAGQSLSPAEHEFAGGGTIVLPNAIGRAIFGVELTQVGTTGGVSTINLSHSHAVNPHYHSIQPHNHFLNLETGYNANTNLKISQDLAGSSWVHADNTNNTPHKHSINGSSDYVGLNTDLDGGTTTGGALGTYSIIPPYIGLLPMLKVKNS